MSALLHEYIRQRVTVSENELQRIMAGFSRRSTRKNELLVSRGNVCRSLFFVHQGCIRTFYIQEKGNESTRYIALEGQFGTALSSFISGQPTLEYVQTPEPSELLEISRSDFYALLDQIPAFEKLYRISLEYAQLLNTWRLESLISMDARSRYEYLMQTNPAIIQRLSNRIVASYLGISQESLSRLKSRKKRG
jgi:CRP-like cAMP-binding protein